MNEHKGVNASKRSIRRDCRRATGAERHLADDCEVRRYKRSQDTGCQVNGALCTCRIKTKRHQTLDFSIVPEQVYACHGVRSYTNIGVGDVKTIHRRKVKKIYLPALDDIGVSSVSSVMIRKHSNTADSDYAPKTTSSKCVGGFWQPVVNVLSEKLSAVVKCLYGTAGFEVAPPNHQKINIEIGNNAEHKKFTATTTQVKCEVNVKPERSDPLLNTKEQGGIPNDKSEISQNNKDFLERKEGDKLSSISVVQHVHDLEHARSVNQEKHSKVTLHPVEQKVEKGYRQMFGSTKSKNQSVVKSKSLLRRRFEALRRGHKKEDAKKKDVDAVSSSPASIGHKAIKDASIVFDLPFLEAESYYDAKSHAPSDLPKHNRASFRQSVTGERKRFNSTNDEVNEFKQGVSGVDKNSEEDPRTETQISSDATKSKICDKTLPDNKDTDKKTGGMKFSFFKRRNKDKAKSEKTCKTKKGVPACCCEVIDGLEHKTLTNSDACNTPPQNSNPDDTSNHEDKERKAWLRMCMTSNINSRDSVKIRWNNKTYAKSSSTVFTIVDNVYKETGIVIRSKSDIHMNKSSYKSSGKKGNFVNQHIEAWMVPNTTTDMPTFIAMNIYSTTPKKDTTKKEIGISKQKRSMDNAKTFSLNMRGEIVLASNHKVQDDDETTSNFLSIVIPDDYFLESCDEENRGTSDEKVYNVVEYETLKSNSDFKKKSNFDTGDHADNDNKVNVDKKDSQEIESRVLETVIKSPPIHKDIVVQDSNVDFPKRCDVIEVGVLTQKDVIDFKPILKLEDDFSGCESGSNNHFYPTGCEFAQSYLQEYYRQCMPLDVVQSSWRGSQSRVRCISERNSNITLIPRDGFKSCPNVGEEYQPSPLISPSHSSCSHCHNPCHEKYGNKILYGYITSFVKSGKRNKAKENQANTSVDKETEKAYTDSKKKKEKKENKDKRILPKDSLEVFKRRQMYAMSNRSRWLCPQTAPCPEPSSADQRDCQENPRVSNDKEKLDGIITYKGASSKKSQPKKTLKLAPACEIPQNEPACKKICAEMKEPPCDKNSEPCPPPPQPSEVPPSENSPFDKNMELCPPRPPPTPQCQIPPLEPALKKNCERMNETPCDNSTEPCPPTPTVQFRRPRPEPTCKKTSMKKPPCPECASSPCSSENNSLTSDSSESNINYKFSIEGSLGRSCKKHPIKCPNKPPDPSCLKDCENMKKPPGDRSSVPCPPSPPSLPMCNRCMAPSPPESGCDENCEKIKKPHNKSQKPDPPYECPSEYKLAYEFSERSINCMISFEEPADYNRCKKKRMKSTEPLKMAPKCETQSPPDTACQKKYNEMMKGPYSKRSKPRASPSPPSESPCHSESDSASLKSSENNTNCIVTVDGSTSYDACMKLPMTCLKHPDSSCQKKNSMPGFQSPGSGSLCRLQCIAPTSQFSEHSKNCMMSYEEATGHDTSQITEIKCPKPFILDPKYDVIVLPPDHAGQKKYDTPPKDKKSKLPPPSPASESPCPTDFNASPFQFSEHSINCMMSVEESSYDDQSKYLEESTGYNTSQNPQGKGTKPHDIIAEPSDRACQKEYGKNRMPPPSYKQSYYPSPPCESPCPSESNASPSQFSDRCIHCSMSFEESTGYECYDTSNNPPEIIAKPYKLAPKYDIIADSPDPVCQNIYDKIENIYPYPPSPSPPSESPCPSECNEPGSHFSDRSITCMMSYEESSEDEMSKNLEEWTEYDMSKNFEESADYYASENAPEKVTKHYKVGSQYDIAVATPNSEYQKKYEKNKKPQKDKKLKLPSPSPPSPRRSECNEPASQFSERSINCMMSFEESAGYDTSKDPPEQAKCDIVAIPPNSQYEQKNKKIKKPQEEDKKLKPFPPNGSPRSSKSSADSRFSEGKCEACQCHKPLKTVSQYDVVVIPPDPSNQKKSGKIKKPPSDERSMPSPAKHPRESQFPAKSSTASLISDCMITYQDIPGFSTCNIPTKKCTKPKKKCNAIIPSSCDKSWMPCPRSPPASPCPSRSSSACSLQSACSSPPPCPVTKCFTKPSSCKESCPEVRLTCPAPNDSFCVKKYIKMQPLLGCKERPPPKCPKYYQPGCSQPPNCVKICPEPSCYPPPTCNKYPPPICSPPPMCNEYPPPSCSPPPMCKKYPHRSCSPPPKCHKYPPPSCSPPPTCKKYPQPSCSPPPMCNKYPPPSCSPPPSCDKCSQPTCSPPPTCDKWSQPTCIPPPKCNKLPQPRCLSPPRCNEIPQTGCLPPPKCNNPLPGCSPPPSCNKFSRPVCFAPKKCSKFPPPGCLKPPKCHKKISCKHTSEKGCDPYRRCESQMCPPPSSCPRPMSKRCVLPYRPCKFNPHQCRPQSAPICPKIERRKPCLNKPGPCRLCAESHPCPASSNIPFCTSKPSNCFKYPKKGISLKKLPSIKKSCLPEFLCKKPFGLCSSNKHCVKTTFVEDGSGRNQTGPNTADEQKVLPRKKTTKKNKSTNKKGPVKTKTSMDKCPAGIDEARSVHGRLLGDIYQPSFCQRVSAKDAQIINTLPKVSSQSLDNIVELQFKIQITQDDKITEIYLGKDGDEKAMQIVKSSCREDYVVNNTATSLQKQVASSDMTNGVNISIVINNFKRKDKKQSLSVETDKNEEKSKIHEDFANKICQKFHTVSTAYSDGIQSDVNRKDSFSAQRATWNLTGSSEKSKTQLSGDVRDLSQNKEITKITTSQNVVTETEEKSCSSPKIDDAKNEGAEVKEEDEKEIAKVVYNADESDKKPPSNKTSLCYNASPDNLRSASNHGEKRNNLKMAVQKKGKVLHKNKVSKLTKLFKAIVKTSESSENGEMPVTNNDLTEDITLGSFKPNFFRKTDSMNNYYKLSSMSSDNDDFCYKFNNSRNIDSKCGSGTCVCTMFAAKLNVLGEGGCPCSSPVKTYVDIETNCDIKTDKDVSQVLSNSPSDYLDAPTQRSRLFISRANSADVSNNNFPLKDNNVISHFNNVTRSKQISPGTYISSHHTKVKSFSVNIFNQLGIENACKLRKFHKETVSNVSDEDKTIAIMKPKRHGKERDEIIAHMEPIRIRVETTEESAEEYFKQKSSKANAPADVLQSYETKKAVLEIYTERTICNCDGRPHLVAKLPKFTIERASEIIKYEKIGKRSFLMSFES